MKKIIYISALMLCGLFVGCNKLDDNATQEVKKNTELNTTGKDCLVAINPIGEITTSEDPMTKASSTPTDDIYCVQVMQGDAVNGYLNFAMGYFDNLEAMKLYLKQGSKYRIIVSMVKNAKNLLGTRYNMTQASLRNCVVENNVFTGYKDVFDFLYQRDGGNIDNGYNNGHYYGKYGSDEMYYWFYATTKTDCDRIESPYFDSSTLSSARPNKNKFFPINHYSYVFKHQLDYYENADATSIMIEKGYYTKNFDVYGPYLPFIEKAILNNVQYPSCDGWFYGEVVDYNPTGDYETLDLNFKRVGFKLKYELSGVTDGEVTVKVYNDTRTFIENTTNTSTYASEEQFIAFYDAHSAWQYADNYSENLTVAVSWKRGIGVTQDLGTKIIQVKRNCLNNIKITLGSDDRQAGMSLSAESESSMGSGSSNHPVS